MREEPKSTGKPRQNPAVRHARDALRELADFGATGEANPGQPHLRQIDDPLHKGQKIDIPADDDLKTVSIVGTELKDHLVKYLEYIQAFLVYNRLGKVLDVSNLPSLPPIDFKLHASRIAATLNAGGSANSAAHHGYYPMPYVELAQDELVPFVDVAGFVVVFSTDFVRWANQPEDPVQKLIVAEVEKALRFLLSTDCMIQDDKDDEESAVGWAFVAGKDCPVGSKDDVPLSHRHIFPTARAIVAIQRYLNFPQKDETLAIQARKVLPRVLKWIKTLEERAAGERFPPKKAIGNGNLVDHLYATEALLSLSDAEMIPKDAVESARGAVRTLLQQLNHGGRFGETQSEPYFEEGILEDTVGEIDANQIVLKSGKRLLYDYRATTGTCLSTLSQGIQHFTGGELQEERKEIRDVCNSILKWLIKNRNASGTWPRHRVAFQWVLSTVEGMLRFQEHVIPRKVETTEEELLVALGETLQQSDVHSYLLTALIENLNREK